jgi:hypothetical protein
VLKTKQHLSNDEFDFLTSEFGAYFGQLIHSQLMKLRAQQTNNSIQAKLARTQSNVLTGTSINTSTTQVQYITPKPIQTNTNIIQKQQPQASNIGVDSNQNPISPGPQSNKAQNQNQPDRRMSFESVENNNENMNRNLDLNTSDNMSNSSTNTVENKPKETLNQTETNSVNNMVSNNNDENNQIMNENLMSELSDQGNGGDDWLFYS